MVKYARHTMLQYKLPSINVFFFKVRNPQILTSKNPEASYFLTFLPWILFKCFMNYQNSWRIQFRQCQITIQTLGCSFTLNFAAVYNRNSQCSVDCIAATLLTCRLEAWKPETTPSVRSTHTHMHTKLNKISSFPWLLPGKYSLLFESPLSLPGGNNREGISSWATTQTVLSDHNYNGKMKRNRGLM